MINKVKTFLKKYNLMSADKVFVVGFSGGYDSMSMLDILNKISKKVGFKLIALHLNHNWRGKEAEIEQENCKSYCEKNDIEYYSETLNKNIQKTETVAREKRQQFFKKCYKKYNADGLFLAHTKSDNTETIIYRLSKGTGVKGLCGILESSMLDSCKVYRPIMDCSRKEVMRYCSINKLIPNNDSSNSDIKYARNFIRHQIVSELKNINPKIDDVMRNLSKIALSEQNIIAEYLALIKQNITLNDCVNAQKFVQLSSDVQKKMILNFLTDNNLDYDSKKVDELFDFIKKSSKSQAGKTLSLAKNLWLFVSKEKICKINDINNEKKDFEILIKGCGTYKFGDKIFIVKKYEISGDIKYPKENENRAYVNIDGFS